MKTILAAALLMTSAVAVAQMPQGGGGGGGGMGRMSQQRVPGISDAGQAILDQAMSAPNPQFSDLMNRQRSVRDQLNAAANAPAVDVDRVATLIKEREDVQSQYRQLLDQRLLNALRQLSPADRGPFMRALAAPPQGGRGQ